MQGMRELLRSSLGKSLSGLSPVDKLAAAWPVACGRAMAERGVVTGYSDGRVVIEVTDAAWLQQMLAMRGQLTGELRRIAGLPLCEIHFEVSGGARRRGTGGAAGALGRGAGTAGQRVQTSYRSRNERG